MYLSFAMNTTKQFVRHYVYCTLKVINEVLKCCVMS